MVNAGADAQLTGPPRRKQQKPTPPVHQRRRNVKLLSGSARIGGPIVRRPEFAMASTRFLDRSARILWARVLAKRAASQPGLQRSKAIAGGLILAATAFFVLKGAAMAAGVGLSGAEGLALWLAGPDPVTSAFSATLQPIFGARG